MSVDHTHSTQRLNMIGAPGALASFLLDQSADFWQARVKSTAESLDRMCMVTQGCGSGAPWRGSVSSRVGCLRGAYSLK